MSNLAHWIGNWARPKAQEPEALLLELAVAGLTVASAVATYTGAHRLVNGNLWTAVVFTIAIQGGTLALAHLIRQRRTRRSLILLTIAWIGAASFSVYTSALGILELQQDSIKGDHADEMMQKNWSTCANQFRDFYATSRSWIADALLSNAADLRAERARELSARLSHQTYSAENRSKLYIERRSLMELETELQHPQLIGSKAPDSLTEARTKIDSAFSEADRVYSNMPESFRAIHRLPLPPPEEIDSQNSQDLLIQEIRSGSARGKVILGIAILLDFLPVLLLAALKPRRSLADWIRAQHIAAHDLGTAICQKQMAYQEHLRISVEPGNRIGTVSFGTEARVLYPADLSGPFEELERSLAHEIGARVKIVSIANAAGAEIVPELPLIPQLDGDLIRLRVEAGSDPA